VLYTEKSTKNEKQSLIVGVDRHNVSMDAARSIHRQASRQHGLVSRQQALALGVSDDAIGWRIRTGEWERVHRGVFRIVGAPATWQQQLMAACLAIPGATASHRGAAALWGLPGIPPCTEVTATGPHRVRLDDVVIHRSCALAFRDRVWRSQIPVTSLPRTVLDLATVLRPEMLESTVDHLLARRRVSLTELRSHLEQAGRRGRRGAGVLRRVLEERRGRQRHVDSGLQRRVETLARKAAKEGLLPEPIFEYPVLLANGRWRYPDVAYPRYRVGIEAQSYEHHSSLQAFSRDLDRTLELMAEDWVLIPVTDVQVRTDAARFVGIVARVLAWRGPAFARV